MNLINRKKALDYAKELIDIALENPNFKKFIDPRDFLFLQTFFAEKESYGSFISFLENPIYYHAVWITKSKDEIDKIYIPDHRVNEVKGVLGKKESACVERALFNVIEIPEFDTFEKNKTKLEEDDVENKVLDLPASRARQFLVNGRIEENHEYYLQIVEMWKQQEGDKFRIQHKKLEKSTPIHIEKDFIQECLKKGFDLDSHISRILYETEGNWESHIENIKKYRIIP